MRVTGTSNAQLARALSFEAYLGLCRPLAQVGRPVSGDDFGLTLERYRNAEGAIITEVDDSIICARPGCGALLSPVDTGIVYRIDEPRPVDAIGALPPADTNPRGSSKDRWDGSREVASAASRFTPRSLRIPTP